MAKNKWEDAPLAKWSEAPEVIEQPEVTTKKPSSFIEQRLPYAVQGIRQAREGNPLAGGLNLANQVVAEGFRPFAIADEYLREVPTVGKPLSNIIRAIPASISGLYDLGKNGINATGIPEVLDRSVDTYTRMRGGIPMPNEQKGEIAEAGDVMGKNVAMLTIPQVAGKAIPPAMRVIEKGVERVGNKLNERQITKAKEEVKFVAPPKTKELNYQQNQDVWNKYISEEAKKNPIDRSSPESAVRQVTDMTQDAMGTLWENIGKVNKNFGNGKIINGENATNRIIENAKQNKYAVDFKPEQVQAMVDNANILEKQMSAQEAVDYIKGMNADLTNYYKKTSAEQANIDTKFGGIAGLKVIRDALAKEYFDKMESFGVKGMREARKDYGSLASMHDALARNITRAEKVTPPATFRGLRTSLPSGAAIVGGLIAEGALHDPMTSVLTGGSAYLLTNYLKNRATPNSTIIRAIGRLSKAKLDKPVSPSVQTNIKGLLPQGAIRTQPPSEKGITGEPPFIQYGSPSVQKTLPPSSIKMPQGNPIEVKTEAGTELQYFDSNGNPLYSIVTERKNPPFEAMKPPEPPIEGEGGVPVVPEPVKSIVPQGLKLTPDQKRTLADEFDYSIKEINEMPVERALKLLGEKKSEPSIMKSEAVSETPKVDYAKEAEKLGAVYQGEKKSTTGEVQSREFIITNPESPAVGANITLRPNENLAERVRQKEIEYKGSKPTFVPEITKPVLKENLFQSQVKKIDKALEQSGSDIKVSTPKGEVLSKGEVEKGISDWKKDNGREKSPEAQALINTLSTGKIETVKQPYEMTKADYIESGAKELSAKREKNFTQSYDWRIESQRLAKEHRKAVAKAKAEGKQIPGNVLADYPELKGKKK